MQIPFPNLHPLPVVIFYCSALTPSQFLERTAVLDFFIPHLTFTSSFWIWLLSFFSNPSVYSIILISINTMNIFPAFSCPTLVAFDRIDYFLYFQYLIQWHQCPNFLCLPSSCSFLVSLPHPSKLYIKCSSFLETLDDFTKVHTFLFFSISQSVVKQQWQKTQTTTTKMSDYSGSKNKTHIWIIFFLYLLNPVHQKVLLPQHFKSILYLMTFHHLFLLSFSPLRYNLTVSYVATYT